MKKIVCLSFILYNLIGLPNVYHIGFQPSCFTTPQRLYSSPIETSLKENYCNKVDYSGFISHCIFESLYNKHIKSEDPRLTYRDLNYKTIRWFHNYLRSNYNNFLINLRFHNYLRSNYNNFLINLIFQNYFANFERQTTFGPSSFLAFMLYGRFFNDEVASQSNINIFATGAYKDQTVKDFKKKVLLHKNIFDCEYEEVKKITQWNKDNFRTLENIEFAAIGMLEKKLANIFLYIKNNKLPDNAIFLSESQKKEVSLLKKKIKIHNQEINDENFLKCIDILNRINYVKNTKELQKLHQANIKTFNHLECPTINTATVQNKHTTLLEFLSLTNELNNLQSAIINKFEDELETATIDKLENKSNPFL